MSALDPGGAGADGRTASPRDGSTDESIADGGTAGAADADVADASVADAGTDLEPTRLDTGKRRVYRAHLVQLSAELLGSEGEAFEFPGGSRRDSCRMRLADGRSVIATVREEPERADLETRVLRALAGRNAPAPRVLAGNRRLLLQEDCGTTRLSVAIHRAWRARDGAAVERLLDGALDSLVELQGAGHAAGLSENVPLLGVADWWIEALIDRPAALGSLLGIKPARPAIGDLRDLLAVLRPRFVKWDARPANAVVDEGGRVSWIDFEHCGARNPLDDLAWLLGDEYVPHDPGRDERLLERHVSRLGGSLPEALLPHYARAMLVLHATHRLNLVVNAVRNGDGRGWRDPDTCVRRDSIGAARPFALRQCERLVHHARGSSLLSALAPFYATCRERILTL